LYVAITSMKFA